MGSPEAEDVEDFREAELETFSTVQEVFEDTTVVDTDVHISFNEEIQREVARYMDQPWGNYTNPDRMPERYRYPSPGLPKALGGTKAFEVKAVTDPETIHEDLCLGLGVDHPIINVLSWTDTLWKSDQALPECKGINDMLLDRFLDDYDHFRGLASISLQARPDKVAEEIDRIGDEDGFVGAFVGQAGTRNQKPPGDPRYDVIYRALEDNGLTPVFHASNFTDSAEILNDLETCFAWHTLAPAWSIMQSVTSLIAQGVPEKFPDLDFVMLEGRIEWIPWLMAGLNREQGQWQSEITYLTKSPEEYIRDQFYFATQPIGEISSPEHMMQLLDVIGYDSLTFASDYFHYDWDNPSAIDKFLRSVDAKEREKVLSGNASDAFDLSL